MPEKKSAVFVALLRGVNVGGNNKLPMKDLARLFEQAGCGSVVTYIQSGNVVFRAGATVTRGLAAVIQDAIERDFGFRTPVVLRSADQLRVVTESNPYIASGVAPEWLHVAFLADMPDPERVAKLDAQRSPPDTFEVRGQEIYLHTPQGVGRSKLTNAWLDAQLKTISTVRNWRTVNELLKMTQL